MSTSGEEPPRKCPTCGVPLQTKTILAEPFTWTKSADIVPIEPSQKYNPVRGEETINQDIGFVVHPSLTEDWWDDSNMWEYPHFSRTQWDVLSYPSPEISVDINTWYYNRRVYEVNTMITRQILMRCLPKFRHQVGQGTKMYIIQMDEELWRYWKWVMNSILPCTKNKTRIQRYPDFGCKRDETIEWKETGLPPLDGDGWYRMKTVDPELGCVYRSEVQWVKFLRDSWTQLIRVEFDYKIEVYHDVEKKWVPC